ncbi:hypothetical protein GY45DRAFT_1373999 [Cubamyces sp. BRFM 1775]|uniref:DUF6534 domain-containing protein n=1 Tax=Trametes cubensis TaxID=1111947 RepID=A0AAD7U0J0_9APHY|nr:hypothetical protein GY45DRAFT_1373999 [Cubamyces sp. BRFM 1775]KAJ8490070.1 hypothetical protein ONZ51_g2543 [Trametes cubensis]
MSEASNVAQLTGPQLLGQFINWGLMGALSVQIYLYHVMFPKDPISLRGFVYGLFVFEWIQTGLITENAFNVFVYNFGDVPNVLKFHNSWFSVPVMCGVVSVSVQFFYARRIFVLSGSYIIAGVICLLALTQGSAAIASGVLLKNIHTAADQKATTPAIATWLGGSALVDIVIAVTMTILLLKTKTGFRRSDSLVNKLVRLVIESGTITASVAIVDVVMFAALPQTLYHECPALALAKLYANMMVTSLNNRAFLQREASDMSTVNTTSAFAPTMSTVTARGTHSHGAMSMAESDTVVRVQVMKESEVDYPMVDFRKHRDDSSSV